MKSGEQADTTVDIACPEGGKELPHVFRASGRELVFKGFIDVYPIRLTQRSDHKLGVADQALPPLRVEEPLLVHDVIDRPDFTKPPSHYTEASLIKELERRDIGRPSAYAQIVTTLFEREYVECRGKSMVARPLSFVVCDFLVQHFRDLFTVQFTAGMEEDPDRIALGERHWVEVLTEFCGPFVTIVAAARETAQEETISMPGGTDRGQPTGGRCPECGGDMMVRDGKYGSPEACRNLPTYSWTAPLRSGRWEAEPMDETSPQCGGYLAGRRGSYWRLRACSNYLDCRCRQPPGAAHREVRPER